MRIYIFMIMIVLATTATYASTETVPLAPGTEVGQVYPNYILPALSDGRPLSLSQFRGRKIILHQFASW